MRKDILIDDHGGVIFKDGDFMVGHSDQDHVASIFTSQKGEWKQWPLIGFGAIDYIKTQVTGPEFKRDLKVQLQYDGYDSAVIDTNEGIEKTKITI